MNDDHRRELLMRAAEASARAYAPYSGLRVGAAIRAHGQVFCGVNVENGSYGLTLCAERAAAVAAVGAECRRFEGIAVVSSGPSRPYPCGACRQVLAEFGNPDTPVFVSSLDRLDQVETFTLGDLLPHAFLFKPRPHTP